MLGPMKEGHYQPTTCVSRVPVSFPKKWIPMLSFLTVGLIIWMFKPLMPIPTITLTPSLEVGVVQDMRVQETGQEQNSIVREAEEEKTQGRHVNFQPVGGNPFQHGTVKPIGEPYTKTLVIPRKSNEDVRWIHSHFNEDEFIKAAIYTVDDVDAELHIPRNKGHEVMVYLSYIIDHYNNLSDVNIFMHSHRFGWHNNELLDNDAVQMISRLSAEHIQREGFMNMRCHWHPGCPDWMHPGTIEEDVNKQEESMLAKSWSELFPLDPIPNVLAQPCCAQFAVSRDRIRSLPLARYVFYRDWLLRTSLSDYISGRVWEYVWQFVFTGKAVVCPAEHVCYCDGFGVCFGGANQYTEYYEKIKERFELVEEANNHRGISEKWQFRPDTLTDEEKARGPPEEGKDLELQKKITELLAWIDRVKQEAKERGDLAISRAQEAGREWTDGGRY